MLRKVDTLDPFSRRNAPKVLAAMLRSRGAAEVAAPSAAALSPAAAPLPGGTHRALGKAPAAPASPALPAVKPAPPADPEPASRPRPLRLAARPGGEIILGLDESGEVVRWDPARLQNAFFCVFGGSGSGKTAFLRVAACTAELPAVVFDFHGDIEIPGTTARVQSVADVNPLEVVSADGPVGQAGSFADGLRRAVPSLGHVQVAQLREAVVRAYARVGITETDADSWTRRAPTVAELRQSVQSADMPRAAHAGLLAALDQVFGAGANRAPSVQIRELLRGGGRIDLSSLSRPAQVLASEVLLGQLWSALREAGHLPGGQYRVLLIVDESARLNGSATLDSLFREARKFGLACMLAAQAPSDVSGAVRNNAASILQLKLGSASEATLAARLLRGPSPQALMDLAPRGDGYFRAGDEPVRVRVLTLDAPERRALRAVATAEPSSSRRRR